MSESEGNRDGGTFLQRRLRQIRANESQAVMSGHAQQGICESLEEARVDRGLPYLFGDEGLMATEADTALLEVTGRKLTRSLSAFEADCAIHLKRGMGRALSKLLTPWRAV